MKTKTLIFNLMFAFLFGYALPAQASDGNGKGLSVELLDPDDDQEYKNLIDTALRNEVIEAAKQDKTEVGAGLFDDEESPNSDASNNQKETTNNQPASDQKVNESNEQVTLSWNPVEFIKDYSKQQCAAVVAGAAVLGYGIYKGYQFMYSCYATDALAEQPIQLTAKESEILINFADAMAQDVKQARSSGNRRPSIVKGFDISGLSMPLVIECNGIQNDFVKLYNECDEQGTNVDLLNMFYCEFNNVVKALLACAEVI